MGFRVLGFRVKGLPSDVCFRVLEAWAGPRGGVLRPRARDGPAARGVPAEAATAPHDAMQYSQFS